ncbi:THUMP domain-containing class I SAM-dependent RNA methyltransferase [Nitrosospira briensis]|uniref:THUMP domain-containing class I SAM-dependent RNA methyltransferase n=1 Tax=Nitrosospira briensis TaxID=35799 RepID=UPI0008E9DBE7|nr:class I SAM-dependent RNA methyltransferase [Nitrosospira briensis]SFO00731.1 putative N6-adenine-specific DNA methylase [Nitrosospira briensis]
MTLRYFFAPCPRGLESVLVNELEQLGASFVSGRDGGVQFQGDWDICYRANLESRIASRILWRVAEEPYSTETDVYEAARALPWGEWFSPALTIRVKLAAIKCPLRSLDFATLKIKDAVCDKFRETAGRRPSVDTAQPDIRIHGFLNARTFSLYVDTSGDALFKRGLRKNAGEAPIRENLAAGILSLTGWQPGIPLLDPMCGSGTFLLEAAQIALDIAPGSGRAFAFEKLKQFKKAQWDRLKEAALSRQKPKTAQPIFGSDLYGDIVALARSNLAAAGFSEVVALKQANFLETSAPASSGFLVTNPPYGVRVGEQHELAEFYPKLGDVLKKKFSGWTAYIVTADPLLPKLLRLTPSRRIPLFNGALECRLLEYKMVAGGMRKAKKASDEVPPDHVVKSSHG